jgi:hypothetical protein
VMREKKASMTDYGSTLRSVLASQLSGSLLRWL